MGIGHLSEGHYRIGSQPISTNVFGSSVRFFALVRCSGNRPYRLMLGGLVVDRRRRPSLAGVITVACQKRLPAGLRHGASPNVYGAGSPLAMVKKAVTADCATGRTFRKRRRISRPLARTWPRTTHVRESSVGVAADDLARSDGPKSSPGHPVDRILDESHAAIAEQPR